MATTVTGLQILQTLLARGGIGQYIANGEITSLAAGSLTSVAHFRRGRFGADEFRNAQTTLWRPSNATGIADDYRDAGTLTTSTGALAVDANWADSTVGTEDVYLVKHGIHPLWIIEAMNLALREAYFQNEDWLSLALDPGFQSTATSSYTESDADGGAATTFSKITTADSFNVYPPFIASGRILNAAANGYIRQRFKVSRGERVHVWWLARADIGAASEGMSLGLYDVTNSAALGTAITSSEEDWQFLERREAVTSGAAGTEDLEVRLQGIGSIDDIYTNGLIVYKAGQRRMPVSTTWDTAKSTPGLSYVTFGQSTASGVYKAWSIQKHEIPASEYRWLRTKPGANPYAIEFNDNHWFNYPILINGRRAHSDVDGPFTRLMTETTSADRDLMAALTLVNLLKDARVKVPDQGERLAEAMGDAGGLNTQFELTKPVRSEWRLPSLRN